MKILDKRNLPEERLATTDESGRRVYVFPATVDGFYRKLRTAVQSVLIILLLILPWINIGGHQAVLFNIGERRFSVFGLTFWAHDGPLIFFILAFLTIGLGFVTALWGRVWCGWACPQTVFIDGVFRRIEYWVIGSHIKQRNLARSPLNSEKILKYSAVWTLFLIVSMIVAHSFLAYFIGAENLVEMTQRNPGENWSVFLVMAFITSVILFDFGWFREQFCIIMCPYGRFQSVLMDEDSVNVTYDMRRGEPRRGTVSEPNEEGDCIDCFKCVDVCPTGIDIRKGQQLECIACTACMDACDEVMDKIDRPAGLIRYASENEIEGNRTKYLRPRSLVYLGLVLLVTGGLIYNISQREDIMVTIHRGTDAPFRLIQADDKTELVINHFKMRLKNQTFEDADLRIYLPERWKDKGVEFVSQSKLIEIKAGENRELNFFIKFPRKALGDTGSELIDMEFENIKTHNIFRKDIRIVGPRT